MSELKIKLLTNLIEFNEIHVNMLNEYVETKIQLLVISIGFFFGAFTMKNTRKNEKLELS